MVNWLPHIKLDSVLLEERWSKGKIGLSHPMVLGCTAYVHVNAGEQSKLDAKAKKMIFLRYSRGVKGYRI